MENGMTQEDVMLEKWKETTDGSERWRFIVIVVKKKIV